MQQDIKEFFHAANHLLVRATADRKSPMRTPVLASFQANKCYQRTIVLRKFIEDQLIFYTDYRSKKVQQIQENPRVSALFYHPKKQFQVTVSGSIEIAYKNEVCERYWKDLTVFGRKSYATIDPPSQVLTSYSDNLPPAIWHGALPPSKSETTYTYDNFAVLIMTISQMECLSLNRNGHKRAIFKKENDKWAGNWIVP